MPVPGASSDRAPLVALGRSLVARAAARSKSLLSTSRFASLSELTDSIAAMGPSRARAIELLKSESSFEFAIRVPSGVRESVSARGFLNQHDTKVSNGTLDVSGRRSAEAAFLGMSEEEYQAVPNSVRPKYGYLRPAGATGVRFDERQLESYGDDVFVFKQDALKNAVTVYPADSLTYGLSVPVPASHWQHTLLPWRDRALLAAGVEVTAAGELQLGAAPPPRFFGVHAKADQYLEFQAWRPLGLEDVERMDFSTVPPSGAFLRALRQNGVRIFKRGETTEWRGDEVASSSRSLWTR